MIICRLCAKKFPAGFMNWRHLQTHGLKPAEYREKYGAFMTPEYAAKRGEIFRKHNEKHGPPHAEKHTAAARDKLKAAYRRRMERGELPPHTGYKHSDVSKKKMSISHKRVSLEKPESMRRSISALKRHTEKHGAWNRGIKITPEHSKKLSAIKQGVPLSAWKGYSKRGRARLMGQREYREWRTTVLSRDNHKCVQCGETKKRLDADHIKSWAKYPDLRYEISNGRTLCISCHEKTESYPKQFCRKNR